MELVHLFLVFMQTRLKPDINKTVLVPTTLNRVIIFVGHQDSIEVIGSENHRKFRRSNHWKDVNEADVKMFFAHLIVMGIVRKSNFAKYWSKNDLSCTSFFGKYMSRNKFQLMYWNLHLADSVTSNKSDPLWRLRPFIKMCDDNFRHLYKPGPNLSLDEATCNFRGRLSFKCYNPRKPNKHHIRIFEVGESETGYIVGFEVYTGTKSESVSVANCLDKNCTRTTKLVIGLLQKSDLLNKGHRVYFDNYYTSVELLEELYFKETYAAGTCRKSRKDLPPAVISSKLKRRGDCIYRRRDTVLALKWFDKREVLMLSTIHEATQSQVKCNNPNNRDPFRADVIRDYTNFMMGIDLSDQLIGNYNFVRRGVKWWRKLMFHFFALILHNSYVLFKKYSQTKMSHEAYNEAIAKYLINISHAHLTSPNRQPANGSKGDESRLFGRHFPTKIPPKENVKRSTPQRNCSVCNLLPADFEKLGYVYEKLPRKSTSYWCRFCNRAMCLEPCFEVYHTKKNFKEQIMLIRNRKE